MEDIFVVSLILVLGLLVSSSYSGDDYFNVVDYGAVCDGRTDDSKAFVEAWDAACATSSTSRVIVPPENTCLLNPIIFRGPCHGPKIIFTISGTIVAPNSTSLWDGRDASQWMIFKDVKGLKVDGFGCIDGRGKPWWDQSCRYHPKLINCTKLAPTALKFVSCNGSSVMNLKMTNSAQTHISVTACNGFRIQNVEIHSPGNSPNTDGIHFQASHHLSVADSTISTGDDCISIGDYLSNIKVSNIACGPGHGISIGSLGKSGNYVRVKNIRVSNSIFNGTTNGARIKTWQVGRGYVKNVRFENLVFHSVKNPIIIDQNYCDIRDACEQKESGVGISNVVYKDIYGTSTTKIAINLNCSRWVPCTGVLMDSIHLTSTQAGTQLNAQCTSAYGRQINVLPPASCLLEE